MSNADSDVANGPAARRFWMPDLAAAHCTHCSQPFTMFRRRHHCRICGKIFCHACSSQTTDGRAVGMEGVRLRVCGDCKLLEGQMLANMAAGGTADQSKRDFPLSDASPAPPTSSLSREQSGGAGGPSTLPRPPLALPSHTGGSHTGKGRVYVMAQEFVGGGGGLGPFDDRARLEPPSSPWFTPGLPQDTLAALAAVADMHLEVLVHRAVRIYMAKAAAPAQRAWAALLLSCARRLSSALDPHVRRGDRQDVTAYCHIKKMADRERVGRATIPAGGAARAVRQPRMSNSMRQAVLGAGAPSSPSPLSPTLRQGDPHTLVPSPALTTPGSGNKRGAAGPCAFDGIPIKPPTSVVGEEEDGHVGVSECVAGVVFRRNLPHKGMREDIPRPRVLLLDDGLQFEVDKRGTGEAGGGGAAAATQAEGSGGGAGAGAGGAAASGSASTPLLSATGGATGAASTQPAGVSTLWGGLLTGKGGASSATSSAPAQPQTPTAGGATATAQPQASMQGAAVQASTGGGSSQGVGNIPSRLSSLSTLIEQDPAYSDLLVSKLLSLRPDVVAISHGASSRVVDGLMRAGVTLITHCKAGVMQRISRCTGARILPSVGFLDRVSEGEAVGVLADRFAVVYAYLPRSVAVRKGLAWPAGAGQKEVEGEQEEGEPVKVSYCTFSGCPDRLYCTVILRGLACDLPAAAAILRYAVQAARQLRCHVAWMIDSGLLFPTRLATAVQQQMRLCEGEADERVEVHSTLPYPTLPSLRLFLHRLVHHLCPLPSVDLGDSLGLGAEAQLQQHNGALDAPWLQIVWAYFLCQRPDGTLPPRARATLDAALRHVQQHQGEGALLGEDERRVMHGQVLSMLRPLMTGSPSLASFPLHPVLDPLLSSSHLATLPLTVLSLLPKQLQQCRPAAVRFMTMAGQGDRPLGDFLESYCLELPVECGHCRYSPYDHTLSLSHGTGRVDITLHRLSYTLRAEGQEGVGLASQHHELVTWSYCSLCKRHVSPISRVSRGTWSMPLAAYCQQVFYGQGAALQGTDPACSHAPMTHHVRYFGRGKQAACFKFSPQSPLAVTSTTVVRSDAAWAKAACAQQCALFARAAGALGAYLGQGLSDLRSLCSACTDTLSSVHPSSLPEGLPAALARWKEEVQACAAALTAATRAAQMAAAALAAAGSASAVADVLSLGAHRREWVLQVRAVQERLGGVQGLLLPAVAQVIDIVQETTRALPPLPVTRGAVGRRSSVSAAFSAMVGMGMGPGQAGGGEGEGGGGGGYGGTPGYLLPIQGSGVGRGNNRYTSEGSGHRNSASDSVGGPPSPSGSPVATPTGTSTPTPTPGPAQGGTGDSRTLKQLQATCSVFSPSLAAVPGPDSPVIRFMSSGHLSLPPGQHGAVVPVDAGLAATCIGYNLASELYWRKLGECVRTAAKRMAALHPASEAALPSSLHAPLAANTGGGVGAGGGGVSGRPPSPSSLQDPQPTSTSFSSTTPISMHKASVEDVGRTRGESTSSVASGGKDVGSVGGAGAGAGAGGGGGASGSVSLPRLRSGSGAHTQGESAVEGEADDALSEISSLSDLDDDDEEEQEDGAARHAHHQAVSASPLPEGTTPMATMGQGVVAGATQAIGRLLSAFGSPGAPPVTPPLPPPLLSESSVGSVSEGGEGTVVAGGSGASAGLLGPILPPMLVEEEVENEAGGGAGQASATAVMFYPSAPGYTGVDENPADNPFGPPTTVPSGIPSSGPEESGSEAEGGVSGSGAAGGEEEGRGKGVTIMDATDVTAAPPVHLMHAGQQALPPAGTSLPAVYGSPAQGGAVASSAEPRSSAALTSGLWSTQAFGTPLKLTPAEMLAVDVKSDIVHMYADMTVGSRCSFTVTAYWALQFHGLRELCTDSQRSFVQSLAYAERWEASGGKSGARFERTCDQRFIIKHVSRTEFDMFCTHIAPAYFKHVHGSVVEGRPSVLVKILGAFKVVVSPMDDLVGVSPSLGAMGAGGSEGGGKGMGQGLAPGDAAAAAALLTRGPAYVFIMDNLFYPHPILPGMRFDLKGKVRAAKAKGEAGAGQGAGGDKAQGGARTPVPSASNSRASTDLAAEASNNPFNQGAGVEGSVGTPSVGGSSGVGGVGGPAGGGEPAAGRKGETEDGSSRGRSTPTVSDGTPQGATPTAASASQVLLDADLLAHTRGHPLPLTDAGKRWLDAALRRDTAFLCGLTVVDYSILIGIGRGKGGALTSKGLTGLGGAPLALAGAGSAGSPTYGMDSLHVGVIDWVRRFDLIKQVESKVKTVVGAGAEPTVVQPERYANRLLTAAARYFAFVPTAWSCLPLCRPQGGEGAEAWEEEDPVQAESKEAYLVGTWGVDSGSSSSGQGSSSVAAPSRPSHRRVHALPPCYPPSPCPPLYIGSRTHGYYSTVLPPWAVGAPDGGQAHRI